MWQPIRTAILFFSVITLLTGIVYPLVVTGLAQTLFARQANGSLIKINEGKTASELVGQPFSEARYFWGRPSATTPAAYNGASSTGSNLGPSNPALEEAVRKRIATLRSADPENKLSRTRGSGDRLGKRARSAYQPGGRTVPGAAGVQGARHRRRESRGTSPEAHPGQAVRYFRRTHGECSAPEYGAGCPALILFISEPAEQYPGCANDVAPVRRDRMLIHG